MVNITLSSKAASDLVSILNESYERFGGDAGNSGYGLCDGTLCTADGSDLEDLIADHWESIVYHIGKKGE